MTRVTAYFIVVLLFMSNGSIAIAQPHGKPCPKPPCPPPVPITGIEILLGMGGIYGIKKIIIRSKKNRG
jgi:hypothetical protein